MMAHDFPGQGRTLSGLGGVNTGRDAAEFILLGSHTVQVRRLAVTATSQRQRPSTGTGSRGRCGWVPQLQWRPCVPM